MFAIRRWLHTEYGDKVITVQKDMKYACSVTMRRIRATIVCNGKAVRITYSECVFVDLII